jgi:hypothetical protein
MHFEQKIHDMEKSLSDMKASVNALKAEYLSCKKFTAKFLSECEKEGISKVAIQRSHKSIPQSKSFVFGVYNSVFTENKRGGNGWPAIWEVVERMGLSDGCGNDNQHQIDASRLVDGVYHLKNGTWHRIKKED